MVKDLLSFFLKDGWLGGNWFNELKVEWNIGFV